MSRKQCCVVVVVFVNFVLIARFLLFENIALELRFNLVPAMADEDTKHGGDNRVDTTTGDIRAPTSLDNRPFRSHLDGALQQFGSQQPDKIVTTKYLERYRRVDLDAFVNDFATKSEECVYARMGDCAEFVQVTNWCELMQSAGLKDTCNNELALAMKVIANTEQFPAVKNANGVDFRLLYLNLSNMMLGHPVQEMNEATAKVLKEVYEVGRKKGYSLSQ